jgi:hypothetical protein
MPRMLYTKITSDAFDRHLLQIISFGGAPLVLFFCTRLISQLTTEPAQIVIGILTAAALAMGMVAIGLLGATRPRA